MLIGNNRLFRGGGAQKYEKSRRHLRTAPTGTANFNVAMQPHMVPQSACTIGCTGNEKKKVLVRKMLKN